MIYHIGRTLYGFSAETGRWAVRDLVDDRFAISVEPGQSIPEDLLPPSPDHPLFGGYFGRNFDEVDPKSERIVIKNFVYKLDPIDRLWVHDVSYKLDLDSKRTVGGVNYQVGGLPFGDFDIFHGIDVAIIRVGRFLCGFGVRTGTWDLLDLGESKEERALRGYQSSGDMVLIPKGEQLFTFNPKTGRFEDVEADKGP